MVSAVIHSAWDVASKDRQNDHLLDLLPPEDRAVLRTVPVHHDRQRSPATSLPMACRAYDSGCAYCGSFDSDAALNRWNRPLASRCGITYSIFGSPNKTCNCQPMMMPPSSSARA